MEKKQLNFDAPLLSVRKSTVLGSSDGQQKKKTVENSAPIIMPDLELEEVTKTCNVPFVWERIPGTPKSDGIGKLQVISSTPKLPPGRRSELLGHDSRDSYCKSNSQFVGYSLNVHSELIEILRENVYANRESDSESVDDAVDTFESMSLNCSISGLGDYEVNDTNPSGTFNVDKQTGEFMMNRFLPAILETPQYVSKKRCVVPVVADETKSFIHRSNANLVLSHHRYAENEHDKCGKRLGKASGFLPHLCVKNSLCVVNPLAIMKSNAQVPKSGTNDITRFTRKACSGPIDKNCRDQNNKRRSHSGVLTRGLIRIDSKTHQPSPLSYSSASCKTGGLSPFMPTRKGLGLNELGSLDMFNRATVTNPKSSVSPCVSMPRAIDDKMVNLEQAIGQEVRSNEVEGESRDDIRESCDVNLQAPLPPLFLPKSPAESWLWQTMQRNPNIHLNHAVPFYAKNLGQKPPVSNTKWETIVKTSHLHRSFSEELVRHVSH